MLTCRPSNDFESNSLLLRHRFLLQFRFLQISKLMLFIVSIQVCELAEGVYFFDNEFFGIVKQL